MDDDREILAQIEWLLKEIGREKVHLGILKEEVTLSERRLQKFLKSYLSEVGALVARRERLKGRWLFMEDALRAIPRDAATTPFGETQAASAGEGDISRLYRQLAKVYHPDSRDAKLAAYFPLLKEAYDRKDIATMAYLEVLASESVKWDGQSCAITRLESLEQRYQQILGQKDDLLKRRHALLTSAEWELMEKVESHGNRSADVVRQIKEAVREEVRCLEEGFA